MQLRLPTTLWAHTLVYGTTVLKVPELIIYKYKINMFLIILYCVGSLKLTFLGQIRGVQHASRV